MPLSPISKKRLAKLKEPGMVVRGTFATTSAAIRAKSDANARAVFDALYGPQKALKKRSKRQIAKDRAWDNFSKFIRLRDADENGIVKCCTCPARKPWKLMQAGHYITRKKEATLFDEKCVQGQCAGCNRWQGGKPIEFEQHLERRYGKGTAEALRIKAVQECRRDLNDYLFIEKTYADRVEWIKQHEPNKFK